MDVQEALLSRRTVHAYATTPVDEALVDQALVAAHHAPNHRLTWPWRFTRVGPATRLALANLYVRLKSERAPLQPETEARMREKVLAPPALVVASRVRSADPVRSREDLASVACAIENLMLSLRGNGVFSKWTTGDITAHPQSYALLGIDPAREEVEGWVWIGYPAAPPRPPTRPPLEDVVRRVP